MNRQQKSNQSNQCSWNSTQTEEDIVFVPIAASLFSDISWTNMFMYMYKNTGLRVEM